MKPQRFPPIDPRFPRFWHGGDYNPDQWLARPDIIDEDFRLFPLAGINTVSLAIFAWARLEPEEGRYTFDWLDRIMDRCAEAEMAVVLATPTGAKPNWMAMRYPEIRRMQPPGPALEPLREMQHRRHNHCPTAPVYREKAAQLNRQLAERYREHSALALWHVSNEYGGECHCPLCKAAFRDWLRRRYGTLDRLNAAWWTAFWSHTFTDWNQVEAIDAAINPMGLDWKRFVTAQTVDFFRAESAPLREVTPAVPVTVNLMGFYAGLDYRRFAPHVDVVSWDAYPSFHDRPDEDRTASHTAMTHDLNRSLKGGRPFMLMESSPTATNWMRINKLLRPGMHRLKSLQAVAHGSDTVQYFQMRKGRGGAEQFHGAVIDHVGHDRTRVFREVAQVGADLARLTPVLGASCPAEVALVFDWESRWALEGAHGPSVEAKKVLSWCHAHYHAFWQQGIAVDVIGADADWSGYRLIVAPSLYLLRDGFGERIEPWVEQGGDFVATFLTGIVDETCLSFTGGWPGPLRKVLGIWSEEIDYLYEDESNRIAWTPGNLLGLEGEGVVRHVCDRIHAESATPVASYVSDFYAGEPAVTVNRYGRGSGWYLAPLLQSAPLEAFYDRLIEKRGLRRALGRRLPGGVSAQVRTDGEQTFVFLLNFAHEPRELILPSNRAGTDLLTGQRVAGRVALPPRGVAVIECGKPEERAP